MRTGVEARSRDARTLAAYVGANCVWVGTACIRNGVPWRAGDRMPGGIATEVHGGIAIEETAEATDWRVDAPASRDVETEVRGGLDDARGCGPIQHGGVAGHAAKMFGARPGAIMGVRWPGLNPGCGDGDCAGGAARPTGDLAWLDERHAAARGTDSALACKCESEPASIETELGVRAVRGGGPPAKDEPVGQVNVAGVIPRNGLACP